MIRVSTLLGALFVLLFFSMLNLSFLTNYDDGVGSLNGPWGMFKTLSRMLFILAGIGYLILRVRHFSIRYKGPTFFLFLFFLLAVISLTYSGDKALSILRLVEHLGIFIGVVALWLSISPESRANHILNLVLIGCFCLVLAVWIFVIVDPLLAFRELGTLGPVLGGSVLHSHTLGHCSAYLLLICFSKWGQTMGNSVGFVVKSLFALFLLATIGLTQSRSSILILAVGVFCILMSKSLSIDRFDHLRRYSVIVFASIVSVILLPYAYEIMLRQGDLSSLETLGSRTFIWRVITQNVLAEAPFFGYGYQMLSSAGAEFELVPGVMRGMAHNAYIQTLGGLGIVGFLIIVFQSAITYFHVLKPPKLILSNFDRATRRHYVLLAIVCFGSSVSEFGMVGPTSPAVPIYFVLVVYASVIVSAQGSSVEKSVDNAQNSKLIS